MELYEVNRHEKLSPLEWDSFATDNYCKYILNQTIKYYSDKLNWPIHRLDIEEERCPERGFNDFYYGAAGILWALDQWGCELGINPKKEYLKLLTKMDLAELANTSIFFGQLGFLLFKEKIDSSLVNRDHLYQILSKSLNDDKNEILFGNPGALLGAYYLFKMSGESRFCDIYHSLKNEILSKWVLDDKSKCYLWTQHFNSSCQFVGAAHGTFGNIHALLRTNELLTSEEVQLIVEKSSDVLRVLACVSEDQANWPRTTDGSPRMLLHWCHGAPGIICTLADYISRTKENDELLLKAGELIWNAGPLRKGVSLCHGTSGNAIAFLKLHKRFKDEKWLNRAKAFTMHCLEQCKSFEREYGQLRYSLWTGDLGLVWLNEQIKNNSADLPLLDVY